MDPIKTLLSQHAAATEAAQKIIAERSRLKMSLASAADEKLLIEANVTAASRRYAGTLVLSPKDSKLEASAYDALQAAKVAAKKIVARIQALTEAIEVSERDRAELKHQAAANSALSQAWQATKDAELAKVPSAAREALVTAYAAACRQGGNPGSWGDFLARSIPSPSIPELDAAHADLVKTHGLAA